MVDNVDSFWGEWEAVQMQDSWHMVHLAEACAGCLERHEPWFLRLWLLRMISGGRRPQASPHAGSRDWSGPRQY